MAVFEDTSGIQAAQADGPGFAKWTGIAGALISLGLMAGLGVWGYKLLARDISGVPVVRAVEGPMRVQPENPGGRPAAHQGLAVNNVAAAGIAEGPVDQLMLAPRPVDLTEDDVAMGALAVQRPPDTTPAESAAAESDKVAALRARSVDEPVAQLVGDVAPLDDLVERSEDPTVAAAPEVQTGPVVSEVIEDLPEPAPLPEIAPVPVVLTGPGLPRSLRPQLRPVRAVLTTAAPGPTPAAAQTGAQDINAADLPAGTKLAQLGAYESAEIARSEWDRLSGRFSDYLTDKTRVVQRATSGGRTFYRLRAMGFDDINDARRFCSALVAEGADCIPVTTR